MYLRQTLPALAATLLSLQALPSAAQSSVTTHGLIDLTVRHRSNAPQGDSLVVGDGAYTGSRLGFRGTEDLGAGLRAFFSLEMGISLDTGALQQANATAGLGQSQATTGRAWGREALVGLSTSVGTVTLGRQYTIAHQLSGRFQPQANPNDAALSVFSGHHVARQDNMAKLTTKAGPVELVASATANEGNGKAWGVGATYRSGALDIVGYASDMKTNAAGADTRKIVGLGGSYRATSALKLFAGGMQRKHAVSLQKNEVLSIGLTWQLSAPLALTASYIDDKQSGVAAGHRKVGLVGLNYAFSKRTDVYAEVDENRITGSYAVPAFMASRGTQTGLAFGLRHRF